jgi:hypothetical protein
MRAVGRFAVVFGCCAALAAPAATFAAGPASSDPFAACRRQFAEKPDDYDSAYCFYQTALKEHRVDESVGVLDGLMRAHPENDWLPLASGHLYRDRDPVRAEALYRRAADGFQKKENAAGEVLARSTLRNYLFPKGRLQDADVEVARVSALASTVTDPLVKAQAWTLQASHLQDSGGDLSLAYRLLKDSERMIFPNGSYRLKRACLSSLGFVAFRLGRGVEALAIYEQLNRLATSENDAQTLAVTRYNVLNVASMSESMMPTRGARQRLMRLAEQALDSGIAARQLLVTLRAHAAIANLLSIDDKAAALEHAKACTAIAFEIHEPHDEAFCSWSEALLLQASDPARALAAERRAVAAAARAKSPDTLAYSAGRRMRLSWETKPRRVAIRDSLEAIDAIESLRGRQDDDRSSAELFSTWTLDYYWFGGRLLQDRQPGDLELAFTINERLRARALLDRLRRSQQPSRAARPDVEFATLDAVQSALADNEALLSFQVGIWETYEGDFGGGSWLIAVTRHGRSVHRIPDRAQLAPAVPIFTGLLARNDGSETAAAIRLYDDVVADALKALPPGIERLILVPDGPLHHLPFDALRAGNTGLPLAARYELLVAPSATLWTHWRHHTPQAASRRALAFADPETASGDRLPHARHESRALVRHLGDVDALAGAAASERALKDRHLRDYDVLHFAAHAIADQTRPDRSAVLLSPGPHDKDGKNGEDGLLQASEIEALDLQGRIVVLSACRTASGAVLSGEGVLSLARAFFEAGAHAVIGTRWPIRDEDAAAIFDRFYRELGAGASLSAALARAKNDAMKAGRPAMAWAGLELLGDGAYRPFPYGSREKPIASSVAAPLALGLVLATVATVRRFGIVRGCAPDASARSWLNRRTTGSRIRNPRNAQPR